MELRCQIKKVPFHKESKSGHWCILVTDAGTAKGECRWVPRPGEQLRLQGSWTTYQGQKEFKFTTALPDIPENPRAQLHYVCHCATGFGPALEQAIWDTYGEQWKHIEPGEVKGVSDAKYRAFVDAMCAMDKSQDYIELMTWMLSVGATQKMADAAWERWEGEAIAIVHDDPYKLAMLPNYGFKDADRLRSHFGIEDNDDRRIRAAISYVILRAAQQGDTAVSWDNLVMEFKVLISTAPAMVDQLVRVSRSMLNGEGALAGWPETRMVAMRSAYEDEKAIWRYGDE